VYGSPAAAAASGAYPPAREDSKAYRNYAAGPDVRTEEVGTDTGVQPPPPEAPAAPRGSGARMRERATGPDTPGLTVSGTLPNDGGCCVPKRKPASRWGR
jgi:hypothetical protein